MITNYSIAIEEKQEPTKKKSKKKSKKKAKKTSKRKSKKTSKEATKKMEMNRSFFSALPRKLMFVILPFFFNTNRQAPLAKSTVFNIERSNINVGRKL